MDKLKELIKKVLNKDVILYIVFGVLTTLVNLVTFYILSSLIHMNENIANLIAIPLSILFAYFTNRKWVFQTKAKGKENIKEFGKFILGRAFTMIVEQGGVIIFYTHMNLPFMPVKLSLTIVVIILNFFLSKFFAFKK